MMQALAILQDSIRELKSRSLFWIALIISALAAFVMFGSISFNDEGWRVLWFETIKSQTLRAGTDGARDMMAFLFNGFFVKFWLAWGAIILALVSTSSIMPEFLASGAIDLTLAKPVSRLKLFLLKVFGACMFVTVQVAVSVVVAYLLIGFKVGIWLNASLLAIPLITVQFLYLYAMSVLVAVTTRSTLASLLVTMLFWLLVFLVQFSTKQLESIVAQNQAMLTNVEKRMAHIKERAATAQRDPNLVEAGQLASLERQAEEFRSTENTLQPWKKSLALAEFGVPKTGDIQKMLANFAEAPVANEFFNMFMENDQFRPAQFDEQEWQDMQEAGRAGQHAVRNVDAAKSLASSLALTMLTLGLAVYLFWRRDF